MIILAIDAGTTHSGWCLWDGKTILAKGKDINEEVIRVMNTHRYDRLVLEMVASYGMAVGQTVFDTCVWIGRFYQHDITNYGAPELIFRKDVKIYMCGQTKAKDSNIIQAIKDRYGEKGTKSKGFNPVYNDEVVKMKADIWQAFALALYAHSKYTNVDDVL